MVEEIADGAEAPEVDGILGIFFEILSQPNDEVVHGPGGGLAGVAPAHLQKNLAGQRLPASIASGRRGC